MATARALFRSLDLVTREVAEHEWQDLFESIGQEDTESWDELLAEKFKWMVVYNPDEDDDTYIVLGQPLTHAEVDELVSVVSDGWSAPFHLTTGHMPIEGNGFGAYATDLASAADLLHAEAERTRYVYHVTFEENLQGISDRGLLPGQGSEKEWLEYHPRGWEDIEGRLFYSPSEVAASEDVARIVACRPKDPDDAVILRVDRKDAGPLRLFLLWDEVGTSFSTTAVAPDLIEISVDGEWVPLVDHVASLAPSFS